jgi:exonuclease III
MSTLRARAARSLHAFHSEDRFLEHQFVRARIAIVEQFLREEQPDVLCLQETKGCDADFPKAMFLSSATNI